MIRSCKFSTDKCVARSLCNSRVSCILCQIYAVIITKVYTVQYSVTDYNKSVYVLVRQLDSVVKPMSLDCCSRTLVVNFHFKYINR